MPSGKPPRDHACTWCQGKGYLFGMGEYTCVGCDGSGWEHDHFARTLAGEIPTEAPRSIWAWHRWQNEHTISTLGPNHT